MIKGILFDVDGTLVMSNDQHALAWQEAFAEYGYPIAYDDIRKLIGKGGDKLISEINPDLNEEEGDGRKIKNLRSEIFMKKYANTLHSTPGARQLVMAIQEAGLKTIVASSAKESELESLLIAGGVQDLLTESTTSDDVDNSKPDPDIVQVALGKIGHKADEVIMIGDTPYDIEAASNAGVKCIAVRCGGWTDDNLQGAVAIFKDPADILDHFDILGAKI